MHVGTANDAVRNHLDSLAVADIFTVGSVILGLRLEDPEKRLFRVEGLGRQLPFSLAVMCGESTEL